MNKVPPDSRYEIKFVALEGEFHKLIQWIKLHSLCFHQEYQDRFVNNVYFDTYEYNAYSENLSGISSRTKVRYRWYGEFDYPNLGTLEIKKKRNYFGWKDNYKVKKTPYKKNDTWKQIITNISTQVDPKGQKWLQHNPQPIIINRYKRKYFISFNKKIRVTIDMHQSVYDQRYKSKPNISHKANIPKTLVLEIKFNREDKELGFKLIEKLPIRVSRNSKYMMGVKAIDGF